MKILILFLVSFSCYADTFLKLDGETLMGFSHSSQGEYVTPINGVNVVKANGDYLFTVGEDRIRLIDSNGDYKYKFKSNTLIELTRSEIDSHPYKLDKDVLETKRENLKGLKIKISQYNCGAMSPGFIKDLCLERSE